MVRKYFVTRRLFFKPACRDRLKNQAAAKHPETTDNYKLYGLRFFQIRQMIKFNYGLSQSVKENRAKEKPTEKYFSKSLSVLQSLRTLQTAASAKRTINKNKLYFYIKRE